MSQILGMIHQSFITIGPFFILLGILIFVHELGHFLVAKFFKVRVEVFSLGFGKKIFQHKHGDTTYCLSIIPAGGYVKMYGDDPNAEVPEDQKQHAFLHKPVSQRIWIVLAGPLMNFFFAVLLMFGVAMIGEHVPGGEIGDIDSQTAAAKAGFQSGDFIQKMNGQDVVLWADIRDRIEASGGQEIQFSVRRGSDPAPIEIKATPQMVDNDSVLSATSRVGRIEGLVTESLSTVVGVRNPKSLAGVAGFKNLDRILSINGVDVHYFRDLERILALDTLTKTGESKFVFKVQSAEDEGPVREIIINDTENLSIGKTSVLEQLGLESSELYLVKIKKDSPAAKAGFQAGDRVVMLGNKLIEKWKDVIDQVSGFKDGTPLVFQVRRDGELKDLIVSPEMTVVMNGQGKEEKRFAIGVVPAYIMTGATPIFYQVHNPLKALMVGVKKSIDLSEMVVMGLVRLVQNQVSAKNIGGMISIGRFASQSFEMGLTAFVKMMALISINLFLLNLLPVPILDGGHLVFFTIEAIKGAPLGLKKMEIAQQVGLILLMSLMAFAFFNDISNLIRPPW